MEKKEKKPIFTDMQFDSKEQAEMIKEKMEKKLKNSIIGIIAALVAEIIWVIITKVEFEVTFINYLFLGLLVVAIIASYVFGGGLKIGFKVTFRIAKTIGFWGWFLVPFPADIFTGILATLFAILYIPLSFFILPIVLVICNRVQIKRDYNAAVAYLGQAE